MSGRLVLGISWAVCTVLTCGRYVRPAGTWDLLGCVHCIDLWAICPADCYLGSLGLGALY